MKNKKVIIIILIVAIVIVLLLTIFGKIFSSEPNPLIPPKNDYPEIQDKVSVSGTYSNTYSSLSGYSLFFRKDGVFRLDSYNDNDKTMYMGRIDVEGDVVKLNIETVYLNDTCFISKNNLTNHNDLLKSLTVKITDNNTMTLTTDQSEDTLDYREDLYESGDDFKLYVVNPSSQSMSECD